MAELSDDEAVKELATRLLLPFYEHDSRWKGDSHGAAEMHLVMGQLPEPLSDYLPLPEGSRVLGALSFRQEIRAEIDVRLSPNELLSFYTDELPKSGWFLPEDEATERPIGGFKTKVYAGEVTSLRFYLSNEGPALNIVARVSNADLTEVGVMLDANPNHSPYSRKRLPYLRRAPDILPVLAPPVGSTVYSAGSGSSNTYLRSEASLVSDKDVSSVHKHYAEQLPRAGWVMESESQQGLGVWSNWKIRSEDGDVWYGQLLVLRRPWSRRKYRVSIQIEVSTVDPDSEYPSDGSGQHDTSMNSSRLR